MTNSFSSVRPGDCKQVLLCFAMGVEATPVERRLAGRLDAVVLTVGVGPRNAATSLRRALDEARPDIVLTCGLAGSLRSDLKVGEVAFETTDASLATCLHAMGARAARFHCSERIVCSAEEKARLRAATGADAVEMESGAIQALCKERTIRCATVRVISDGADEGLPLDFNTLTGDDGNIAFRRLGWALLRSPASIPALARLWCTSRRASQRLASFLVEELLPPLT